MEPFKNRIDAAAVARVASLLGPDGAGFEVEALDGLEGLELKARVAQVADALAGALGDFPSGIQRVVAGLGRGPSHAEAVSSGFWAWPLCTYVERHGLEHPELALDAMEQLTSHFSCEFAIRPYFAADPQRVLARAHTWTASPDVHVRRLASEGLRPRLPWGMRLTHRIDHPEAALAILEALRDDPEPYVRRSVANHLNDIAKDHPGLVLDIARRWLQGATGPRTKLVRHALRTRIKAGDPEAFRLLGLEPFEGRVGFEVGADAIGLGDRLPLRAEIHSMSSRAQRIRVDLGLHLRRSDGTHGLQVIHWTERTVAPGASLELDRMHLIRRVTTRRHHSGEQWVDLRINGIAGPRFPFLLHIDPKK